jgi:hypothetical protein
LCDTKASRGGTSCGNQDGGCIESLNFVRVSNGRLAAWDCTGELAYVLEARADGMLIPADVREWRGRLSTKEITADGWVIVRVI